METCSPTPYIHRIKVTGMYGLATLDWHLQKGVNILSGINGSGKSTVVESVRSLFLNGKFNRNPFKPIDCVEVYFDNGEKITSDDDLKMIKGKYRIDTVSTFDSPLKMLEAVQKLTDDQVRSDLDWELYRLQKRYLSYQVTLGKKAINMLIQKQNNGEIDKLMDGRNRFYEMVDGLFKETHKSIVRESEDLLFRCRDTILTPYQLSSGEKQMMIILVTVLTQNCLPYILIMDEPEISLHFDWQKSLIHNMMALNPNLQLIMATHSPAVIMDGWLDRVTDIEDLIVND